MMRSRSEVEGPITQTIDIEFLDSYVATLHGSADINHRRSVPWDTYEDALLRACEFYERRGLAEIEAGDALGERTPVGRPGEVGEPRNGRAAPAPDGAARPS